MKKLYLIILLLLSQTSFAKTQMVTSTTDLAWLGSQIGGDLVEVKSLLTGTENAHFVDAVPSFISQVANADILCFIGLDLEIGWLPKIMERSGNAKVQSGGSGYCEVGKEISVLEKVDGSVDRSLGDLHPFGNPHFWLSPERMISAGEVIMNHLASIDPGNLKIYEKNFTEIKSKIEKFKTEMLKKLEDATKGKELKFIQYHKDFTYFFDSYKLNSIGSIEEKPGVAPAAGQLVKVALQAKKEKVTLGLALDYQPQQTIEKFSELSGVKVFQLPGSIRPSENVKDFFALQSLYIDSIVKGLEK